mmetsp:Transcript_6910/g.12373  ORF Transcript_6910/g.12373 Transcript_6910/m.12373 type:complete len:274 (+) Transcript_6910:92-913(+)
MAALSSMLKSRVHPSNTACNSICSTLLPKVCSSLVSRFSTSSSDALVLFGAHPCPFVERVELALKHFNAPYSFKTFDLGSLKDRDSLHKMSPYGRVPILQHDNDKLIFESMSIVQYLDDEFSTPESRLMRGSSFDKALTRSWTHFLNNKVAPMMWNTLVSQDDDQLERNYDELVLALESLDTVMRVISGGPFFLGNQISYLDVMLAPFLHRRVLISHFKKREMFPADAHRLKGLCEALEELKIYRDTMVDPEIIINAYQPYFEGRLHPKFGWH